MGGHEQLAELHRREPAMQCHEPIDATGDRHGADVVLERHRSMPLGPQLLGIGAGAGSAGGVEGDRGLAGRGDEREQVPAQTAHVRRGDGHHRARRDRRVDGVAATLEDGGAGKGRQMIGSGDGSVGGEPGEHAARYRSDE